MMSYSSDIFNNAKPHPYDMGESDNIQKSKRVVVRLKIPLHEFLNEFAQATHRTLSDVVREAIEEHYVRLFLNRLNPTTEKLKKEFIEKFGTRDKRMKNLRKRPVKIA